MEETKIVLERNRTLLVRFSFLTLLLAVIGIGMFAQNSLNGGGIILLAATLVIMVGVVSGFFVFLNRYPADAAGSGTTNAADSGSAFYWMSGFLLIVFAGEIYYLICRYFFGLAGTVEKFGPLGDSFGPLASIFTGLTLLLEILTSRSQSRVQQKQQEQINQQTTAWIQQAEHQKSQAEELKKNNDLYRHMILAQRMSTAATIRARLAELYVDKQKFLRENSMQGARSAVTAALHNLPYNNRVDYEIKQLVKMLAFEVDMISRLMKEIGIGITEEELNEIKQWEEVLSSPMK